jgi:hypothetical protein
MGKPGDPTEAATYTTSLTMVEANKRIWLIFIGIESTLQEKNTNHDAI